MSLSFCLFGFYFGLNTPLEKLHPKVALPDQYLPNPIHDLHFFSIHSIPPPSMAHFSNLLFVSTIVANDLHSTHMLYGGARSIVLTDCQFGRPGQWGSPHTLREGASMWSGREVEISLSLRLIGFGGKERPLLTFTTLIHPIR